MTTRSQQIGPMRRSQTDILIYYKLLLNVQQTTLLVTFDLWVGLQVTMVMTPTTPHRQQRSVDHHSETKLWGKRTATHKMRVAEAVESLLNRRKTADQGDTGPTASSREDLMESSSSPSALPCRVVSSRTASRYGTQRRR